MKLIKTEDLVPGMKAAGEVTDEDNAVKLLSKGARLTLSQIAGIRNRGVEFLHIAEAEWEEQAPGSATAKADFMKAYVEVINGVIKAFRHIRKFQEVPINEMQKLAEQRIASLVETRGVLDYLQEIKRYSADTFQHSLNVAIIAGLLGKWRHYKGVALNNLILAGLLHDIGKLAVPLPILDKPGKLSDEEFSVIKQHPRAGYQLVKEYGQVAEGVKLSILQHHERADRSGYPAGLSGEQIQAEAKIIAIADIYAAMTSDRVYRRKVTPFAALEEIAGQMFARLEPEVCLTFLEKIRDHLTGSRVVLTNGQTGRVLAFDGGGKYAAKPIILMADGLVVDLKQTDIHIAKII
jgi:putative nucleotidyltransferase with HDIG domain